MSSFHSRIRGPDFFLSSEQNASDDFLAWMKAESGNYSTTNGSDERTEGNTEARASRHSHAPLISRQYAYNNQNHRLELVLNDQIKLLSQLSSASSSQLPGSASLSSTSFLPPSSSLSSRGGYISHAHSTRSQLPMPHGPSLSSSLHPNFYHYAAFVPVCERGPQYAFGTGRSGDDELEVKRKRLLEERAVQRGKEQSRRRAERERREAEVNGEEKEQLVSGVDEENACDQPPVNHIRHNVTTTAAEHTVASRLQRQLVLAQDEQNKRRAAHAARQALQAERDARHQSMLMRHDPAWRAQRRQQQEEAERARILQHSWLLLVTVASRVEVWRRSVEHYQSVMRSERSVRTIVQWFRRCCERRRKQRFHHARRVIRLFWEERLAVQHFHDAEADKRRALDVVLSFLSWATNRRKQAVQRAFGVIETKCVVIQRAWRQYATVQKWRLLVQVLQVVQFKQHPDTYEREKERAEDDDADRRVSLSATSNPPSTAASRPTSASSSASQTTTSRPSSRSTLRSPTTILHAGSSIPRQRIRYFRFLPPIFKSSSPSVAPETSHMGTGGLQRWNAMVRWQRELFYERLSEEVRLHHQRGQRRKIEEARDDLIRLASPRAGGSALLSPRQRMLQPTACGVEWPQAAAGRDGAASGGGGRLRHWLLTSLQLHEMHRRALKTLSVVPIAGTTHVERLYVIERTVKYVRRRAAEQREEGGEERRAGRGKNGRTTWATVRAWQQTAIMQEVDEEEAERRAQEEEIRVSRQKANSVVSQGESGELSTLARFQLQLKQNAADEGYANDGD